MDTRQKKYSPDTAIILAAGNASRLGLMSINTPKAMLKIKNKPLILYSVEKLLSSGIKNIRIVVNDKYNKDFEFLKMKFTEVEIVVNDKSVEYGNIYSLILGVAQLDSPFLILDADIAYEKRALDELLDLKQSDSILVSGFTNSKDEVWVCGVNKRLKTISKIEVDAEILVGEFVGISKVSLNFFNFVISQIKLNNELMHQDYEYFLNSYAHSNEVEICFVQDLIWGEIDTVEHFNRMTSHVFPEIVKSELSTK